MTSHAPNICDLREPTPDYDDIRRSRRKQISRIICHLRDELQQTHPKLNMPTRWMVECLVYNAYDDAVSGRGNWEAVVITTLKTARDLTTAHLRSTYHFTQCDGLSPLFPNRELFDEWDAFRFCQTLVQHLEQTLSPDSGQSAPGMLGPEK